MLKSVTNAAGMACNTLLSRVWSAVSKNKSRQNSQPADSDSNQRYLEPEARQPQHCSARHYCHLLSVNADHSFPGILMMYYYISVLYKRGTDIILNV